MDAKVSMKVAGRPRRVLEWRAGCERYSEPENNGEERGKGERGRRTRCYQILLPAVAGLAASIPPRGGAVSKLRI